MYEALRRNWGGSPIESQGFLVPQTVEVGAREKGVLLEKGAQLLRLGIDLEHFGGNTFLLRSVPALMTHADWPVFLADLVVRLAEGDLAQEAVLDGALSVMACHGALRAGQRLSLQEMEQLLQQLERAELGTHCPHGRPVTQRFSFREIEKRFKRVT